MRHRIRVWVDVSSYDGDHWYGATAGGWDRWLDGERLACVVAADDPNAGTWNINETVAALLEEGMRTDFQLPLFD